MTALRFIEIDGKRYLRREIVQLCREQRATMQPISIGARKAERPLSIRRGLHRKLTSPQADVARRLTDRLRSATSSCAIILSVL
jgi:hypothetical protein